MKPSLTILSDGTGTGVLNLVPETPLDGEVIGFLDSLLQQGLPLAVVFQRMVEFAKSIGEPGLS